jgi:hypothetical protein
MHMRRVQTLSVSVLLLSFGISARADIFDVAPNANASMNGNGAQFFVFDTDSPITFQWDIAASQLTSLVGLDITALGFRLPGGASTVGSTINFPSFDLELSSSLNPLGSLSSTPASNVAANAVTVYNAPLTIPANSLIGGPGPNPFYLIEFTTPFLYTGGDLLMTLQRTGETAVGVDANSVDSLGDTVGCSGGTCFAQFYNYPITEFEATSAVPETSSVFLMGTVALGCLAALRRKLPSTHS